MVKKAKQSAFSPKMYKGMSKKRMQKNSSPNMGLRLPLGKGKTLTVMMLEKPEDATESERHVFQENGRWMFVPCAGDACPLCQSEDSKVRGTSYFFVMNVYNMEAKKVQILEGPQDLAQRVFHRYKSKKSTFMKRAMDVTMFDTKPVKYQFELSDERAIKPEKLADLELLDHQAYLAGEMQSYYGDEMPAIDALDDDEDEDEYDDEDEDLEDDDDLDDEDDDDEEDDEDDDDDEDDEPPAKSKSKSKSTKSKKKGKKKS